MQPMRSRDAFDLGDGLADVVRHLQRAEEALLEPMGVTWAQARVMRAILGLGRPVHMGGIAHHLGIVPRSATSMVDELERNGLVERRADPDDRRGVLVDLTPRGRTVAVELRRLHQRAVAQVLAPLPKDDRAELERVVGALRARRGPGAARAACIPPERTRSRP